jgi:hypothetical protein
MNPFEELLTDTVYILTTDTTRSGPYKTSIGTKGGLSATIFDKNLDVQEGVKLLRPLPNGREELYTVVETNFNPGLREIPAHWNLKLEKDSSLVGRSTAHKSTTIKIKNSQGIQIGDHNVQHIKNGLAGLIEEINASSEATAEKNKAKSAVRELLTNPIIAAILGGAAPGLLAMLMK